ncbi:MAG: lmo0937 family membrane protein [Capsulimonadaceae bacterium]
MGGILYTIISILFVLWVVGLVLHIGGGLIHMLLVLAIIMFLYNIITRRRSV